MKVYREGTWVQRETAFGEWWYSKPGEYEEGEIIPEEFYIHKLDDRAIHALIPALENAGYFKPRLDERLREEDLKITHRLLDIIEDAGMNK